MKGHWSVACCCMFLSVTSTSATCKAEKLNGMTHTSKRDIRGVPLPWMFLCILSPLSIRILWSEPQLIHSLGQATIDPGELVYLSLVYASELNTFVVVVMR